MGFDVNNKKCAVCQAYLFEEDDVVCCPICGAPHHRDCYLSIGHCGLEKYHGTDMQYSPEDKNETKDDQAEAEETRSSKSRICTQCGKDYPRDARFCPYCGYSEMTGFFADGNLHNINFNIVDDNTDIGEGVTAKEASGVIQINHFRYIAKFLTLSKKKKTSWNWAGFLLPGGWFAYRKMYKEGIIAVVFSIISTLLSVPLSVALMQLPTTGQSANSIYYYIENFSSIGALPLALAGVGVVVGLILRIFTAIYGDWFYKKRVVFAAKKIKNSEKDLDSDELEEVRKKYSGISFLAFMIAFFAMEFIPSFIVLFI